MMKNCPFCGGAPQLKIAESDPEDCVGFFGPTYYWIQCHKCNAQGLTTSSVFDKKEAITKARELWNKRKSYVY